MESRFKDIKMEGGKAKILKTNTQKLTIIIYFYVVSMF